MSKDINVWKSFRSSENCKKLSLIGDTEKKGPVPKWEALKLDGWLMIWPWKSSTAFTFRVLKLLQHFKQKSLVIKSDS